MLNKDGKKIACRLYVNGGNAKRNFYAIFLLTKNVAFGYRFAAPLKIFFTRRH